ncbi:MAG: IS1634 family transposase [Candidatus Dormibacterales bacterium]
MTYTSYYLRRSFRHDGKVKHETLGNLSDLPVHVIDLISRSLKGETFVPADEAFRVLRTRPHGHVEAILTMIRRLGLDSFIASRPSRQRDLVTALIAERLLFPCSKLATTRHWLDTTLAEELHLEDATEDELYAAMDWLLERQKAIEAKLAKRHLADGGLVLYDVSSSYYEGETCPLARRGHDRDGKTGRPIIVYGVLTDADGRPVAVQVYPGDTGDPTTVPDQVTKLSRQFGLSRIVLVGDRGMLTQTQINTLKEHPGLGWISALRSPAIRGLLADGHLNRSLFDAVNLAEIASPDFPGERLVACYNPLLAEKRRQKRESLLAATEARLTKLARAVSRRTKAVLSAAEIGVKAGRVIGRHKMAKHIQLTISDGIFTWKRDEVSIKNEGLLDGIYVIRTSEPAERLPAAEGVRDYKRLSQVEQAFRCLKGIDLLVRPIHHRLEPRVRAHVLICVLAYYVEWHLRRAWRPLLFEDEELDHDRATRDPVAAATPSDSVRRKKSTHRTVGGLSVHSFRTLLAHLGTRSRETYRVESDPGGATFARVTELDPVQGEALRLLET